MVKFNLDLNGKTILVTGAAGFIGSNLAKRLINDYKDIKVIGLDTMTDYYDVNIKKERLRGIEALGGNWSFVEESIANKEVIDKIFTKNRISVVVNLAAQAGVRYSITNPDAYIQSNLIGFYNILEACRHHEVDHLVYASSSSVYGSNKKVPYSTEDKVDNPVSLYAATKKSNELMAHAYSKLYNIPSTGLRFFTVYGPAGRPDMAYFGFTNKLREGKTIQIFNYGNCKRDFTYVDDIVEGVLRVMQHAPEKANGEDGLPIPPYKVYNIGNNSPENSIKYKKLVFVSLFITISGVIIGILGVVYSKYKYEFRVSSPIFVTTFIGIILYLNTYKQADYKFTTKYWKYALVLSIPLLPHYLSIKILNQVDRVMITQMVGLSETGLYNLACTVSNLMIIATDAINRSMCPYVYKSIKNKNILPVRKMTSSILLVVMVVSFLEMLIAPELIKIFATDDYLDAIYVIPPVAMSIYFIFLYVVFANVEFYFEKTIFATIVSGIAAVMNIGMNYIFLKKYGYYAAGYTTLICYMLFALLHYWNYKRILKREPYLNGIFDIRHVLLISFSGLALMGICLLLYRYSVIRFSLVIIIITISFYFRNQLKSIIKTSNN